MMTKLSKLGIIGGAMLLTATPLSLQWSQMRSSWRRESGASSRANG